MPNKSSNIVKMIQYSDLQLHNKSITCFLRYREFAGEVKIITPIKDLKHTVAR